MHVQEDASFDFRHDALHQEPAQVINLIAISPGQFLSRKAPQSLVSAMACNAGGWPSASKDLTTSPPDHQEFTQLNNFLQGNARPNHDPYQDVPSRVVLGAKLHITDNLSLGIGPFIFPNQSRHQSA